MLLGAHQARAEVPSHPQPIPRKVPDAQGLLLVSLAALLLAGAVGQPCPATPPPPPPSSGSHLCPTMLAPGSSQSFPSGERHYLCMEGAENKPWLSREHKTKTNFICKDI